MALTAAGFSLSAETVAFYATGYDYTGDATASTAIVNNSAGNCCDKDFTAGDVTIKFNNTQTNVTFVSETDGHVRFYQGDNMTMTVPDGATITKIFCQTVKNSKGPFSVTPAEAGTVTGAGTGATTPITWEGAAKGTITLNADKQVRFSYMEVTYTYDDVKENSAAPVFTPESGTSFSEDLSVTIAAADGAKIYYTLDESTPTEASSLYNGSITISGESTTVKAIAVEDGKNPSVVVSATYIYDAPLNPDQKEVEFVFADYEWENAADVLDPLTKDGVTLVFAQNGNTNGPKYYNTGKGVRMYSSNQLSVSAENLIELVEFTFASGYGFENVTAEGDKVTVTPGSYTENGTEGNWTVGDTDGMLTVNGTTGSARIVSIRVILNTAAVVVPASAAPVFTPESGTSFSEDLSVTIAAADGATIYYTLDGTDPTTESDVYAAPIVLTKTTVVKAMALEEGKKNSPVVTATYTYEEKITTLDKLIELGLNDETTEFTYTGTAAVTYQSGSYLFIQDETSALCVYGSGLPEYTNGDRITGFSGKFKNYYGMYELMATAASFTEGEAGEAVEPEVIDMEEITPEMQNYYVKVQNVKVDTENYKLIDAKDADMVYYNRFNVEVPADDKSYDVVAIVNYYQAKNADAPALQLYPVSFSEAAGINGVTVEAGVYVENGAIVAPSDAVVYSVNGAKVNPANVATGLYIVKLANGQAVKLLVK